MQRCSDSLKHCEVSLQVGVALEDGVRNKFSSVEHAVISAALSPNSSTSIENRNLNIFPYKLTCLQNFLQTNRCSAAER